MLRTLTGSNVPVTLVFEFNTVRGIAEVIVETEVVSKLDLEVEPLHSNAFELEPSSHSYSPPRLLPLPLTGDDELPPPSPPHIRICRCLMLHGLAANAQLMETIMRQMGWLSELATLVEFVFVDALYEFPAMPALFQGLVEAGLYGDELGQTYYDYGCVSCASFTHPPL